MLQNKPEPQKIMPFTLRIKDPRILELLQAPNCEEFLEDIKTYHSTCVDLIIDIWKLKKALNKIAVSEELAAIKSNIQRFDDSLKKNGFEVRDLVGEKYNSGLTSIDPIHFEEAEKDELMYPIISEMIRPVIYLKGRVIERGEVIVKKPYSEKRDK